RFVPAASVDAIWLDRAHYLTPSDEVGEEAYAVIRKAMEVTSTAGLARLVLYRRERSVLLSPRDRGIVLWTLRYADEVRDADAYFAGIKDAAVKKDALSLAEGVIAERVRDWSPKLAQDKVQDALLKTIAEKRKHKKLARKAKAEAKPDRETGKVINIMD